MLVNKITVGFVVQVFDTEKGQYIRQDFIAGDEVDYEVDGEPVVQSEVMPNPEPYLPFDMVQPGSQDENG